MTQEQIRRLMDDDNEPQSICVHEAEVMHVHTEMPGGVSMFAIRFAGHKPYDSPDLDAHPDTPFPDDALASVDVYFSRAHMMDMLADMSTELRDASMCDAVQHATTQAAETIMESLDDFINRLPGNGDKTDD